MDGGEEREREWMRRAVKKAPQNNKKKRRTKNRRKEEPKIVKNKPQKTRKHTKPRCGKKKIMV